MAEDSEDVCNCISFLDLHAAVKLTCRLLTDVWNQFGLAGASNDSIGLWLQTSVTFGLAGWLSVMHLDVQMIVESRCSLDLYENKVL